MLNWLYNLFMNSTANMAMDAAVYSAGLASNSGLHQIEAPDELREAVQAREALRRK